MTLEEGIAELGLTLPPGAAAKLAAYLALLAKWNSTYNLSAIRDPEQMVTHHLLDSLAVLPHLDGVANLADVGSGAGLPGIPLAVCRPDLAVTSIEANQKKSAFQVQAKIELGLGNLNVHAGRVEDLERPFDAAICRAFSSLADFVRQAGHLAPRLYAMKGVLPREEMDPPPAGWRLAAAVPLRVPGLAAERHLIVLERI